MYYIRVTILELLLENQSVYVRKLGSFYTSKHQSQPRPLTHQASGVQACYDRTSSVRRLYMLMVK
jgi:hypothetical protein